MTPSSSIAKPIEILLVEDSETDALLTVQALEYSKMKNHLHHVEDGVEALAYLRQEGRFAESPLPGLILLDLNMPRMNGHELLGAIKQDPRLQHIPVVVLTTSHADEDVVSAYGHHANCYIVKPVDFEQFARVVHAIDVFWFSVVTLPRKPASPSVPKHLL